MPTYKYTGDHPVSMPAYGVDIAPGFEFGVHEDLEPINHPDFELVEGQHKTPAKEEAKKTSGRGRGRKTPAEQSQSPEQEKAEGEV